MRPLLALNCFLLLLQNTSHVAAVSGSQCSPIGDGDGKSGRVEAWKRGSVVLLASGHKQPSAPGVSGEGVRAARARCDQAEKVSTQPTCKLQAAREKLSLHFSRLPHLSPSPRAPASQSERVSECCCCCCTPIPTPIPTPTPAPTPTPHLSARRF
jgi:hypothetical protein